jgi:hypothetical protein
MCLKFGRGETFRSMQKCRPMESKVGLKYRCVRAFLFPYHRPPRLSAVPVGLVVQRNASWCWPPSSHSVDLQGLTPPLPSGFPRRSFRLFPSVREERRCPSGFPMCSSSSQDHDLCRRNKDVRGPAWKTMMTVSIWSLCNGRAKRMWKTERGWQAGRLARRAARR